MTLLPNATSSPTMFCMYVSYICLNALCYTHVLYCPQLDVSLLLIIICNLPQPTLKSEDILSEVRWAVFYAMLLAPVLAFIWLLPLMELLKVQLPAIFDYIYLGMFSLQVSTYSSAASEAHVSTLTPLTRVTLYVPHKICSYAFLDCFHPHHLVT